MQPPFKTFRSFDAFANSNQKQALLSCGHSVIKECKFTESYLRHILKVSVFPEAFGSERQAGHKTET